MLMLAEDESGERMTDKQLRDEVMTLFLAGHETTANTPRLDLLASILECRGRSQVGRRARTRARRQDPNRGRPASAALLGARHQGIDAPLSTAWVMGRSLFGECEVGGYRMPAGTTALMSQWVVHRDPRYHRDPQRFDPDRWTAEYEKEMPRFAYFPFGGGPRQCIGAGFAMTEPAWFWPRWPSGSGWSSFLAREWSLTPPSR